MYSYCTNNLLNLEGEIIVCDIRLLYVDLAKVYFPNATIIIDKYHFIRYMTWAIENVRKRL